MENPIKNFICISNYFKGNDFLINLKKQGNKVYLITSEKLRDKPWAFEYIDEIYFMPGQDGLETLAAIRAMADPPPVVYVTGTQESRIAIAALKAAMAREGAKEAVFEAAKLAQPNRQGRKIMQSYFKKKGVAVGFSKAD